jgi:LemA protein
VLIGIVNPAYAIGLILLISALAVVLLYNRLIRLRNKLQSAFSQMDVQLKRRHDLIGNLVNTVRGYLKHENHVMQSLAEARARADATSMAADTPIDVDSLRSLGESEQALTGALGRLLIVVESYPDLKASRNMADLMEALTTTENRIAFARQAYNDAAMFYNAAIQTVPATWLAAVLGFQVAGYFEIENASDRAVPQTFEVGS